MLREGRVGGGDWLPGRAGAPDVGPMRSGGRPRLPPIRLSPAKVVPMTAKQHEVAIQTLAIAPGFPAEG
jgi:hypothetical protein